MLAPRLLRLAAHFPAVLVTGARQAGKTTLMRAAFPDHHYVSLDLPTTADQAERNPDLFLHHHPAPDFVRDAGGVLSFMECTWSERPTARDARGLLQVSAALNASRSPWRPGPHYVIGRPVSSHSLGEGVAAVALRDLSAIVSFETGHEASAKKGRNCS